MLYLALLCPRLSCSCCCCLVSTGFCGFNSNSFKINVSLFQRVDKVSKFSARGAGYDGASFRCRCFGSSLCFRSSGKCCSATRTGTRTGNGTGTGTSTSTSSAQEAENSRARWSCACVSSHSTKVRAGVGVNEEHHYDAVQHKRVCGKLMVLSSCWIGADLTSRRQLSRRLSWMRIDLLERNVYLF